MTMDLNLFQISSITIIVLLILILWFKYGISDVFNYFTGFVFIICYDTIFENKAVIYLVFNLLFFNVIFISCFWFCFIERENRKEKFFLFPTIFYLILIFLEVCFLDPFRYFGTKFIFSLLPVFLAFFPLYILKYYRKYVKHEK